MGLEIIERGGKFFATIDGKEQEVAMKGGKTPEQSAAEIAAEIGDVFCAAYDARSAAASLLPQMNLGKAHLDNGEFSGNKKCVEQNKQYGQQYVECYHQGKLLN